MWAPSFSNRREWLPSMNSWASRSVKRRASALFTSPAVGFVSPIHIGPSSPLFGGPSLRPARWPGQRLLNRAARGLPHRPPAQSGCPSSPEEALGCSRAGWRNGLGATTRTALPQQQAVLPTVGLSLATTLAAGKPQAPLPLLCQAAPPEVHRAVQRGAARGRAPLDAAGMPTGGRARAPPGLPALRCNPLPPTLGRGRSRHTHMRERVPPAAARRARGSEREGESRAAAGQRAGGEAARKAPLLQQLLVASYLDGFRPVLMLMLALSAGARAGGAGMEGGTLTKMNTDSSEQLQSGR
eukprot:scaffold175_cov414-Prasinococcus_capsulatus_cf.AAC.25